MYGKYILTPLIYDLLMPDELFPVNMVCRLRNLVCDKRVLGGLGWGFTLVFISFM